MKRKHKYNAQKIVINGNTFDSQKEAKRYQELLLLERAGKIANIQVHTTYEIVPTIWYCKQYHYFSFGKKECEAPVCTQRRLTYTDDFSYDKVGHSNRIVEDVKGCRSKKNKAYQTFLKKKRLMKIIYGIDVQEI